VQPDRFTTEDLIQQAQNLQRQLFAAHAGLADAEVIGTAGGGLVRVTMTAAGEVRSVHIDRKAFDPDDIRKLEALIVAAMHDATDAIRTVADDVIRPLGEAVARFQRPGQ
jgi:nucleoid-associated protein EbfC